MRWAFGLAFLVASTTLWSLGPEVNDAVKLELQGRLTEAREAYRTVLLSRDFGNKPTPDSQSLRLFLLKKLGHLAVDLGLWDEAWDLQLQMRSLGSPTSVKSAEELKGRLLKPQRETSSLPWNTLPSPASLGFSSVSRYSRLQLGAFSNWNHVRTQLDILLEKGWSPWCEERLVGKERLVALFVVSHEPQADLARLRSQGFAPTASAIDVRG